MKTLAIVPMRSGSKGLPGKNAMKISGKYLIDIVLGKIVESKRFNYVLCSTDSKDLAELAVAAGARVPFLRPSELSGDRVPTSEVVSHSLRFLRENKAEDFTHVFVFQVTSPLVTLEMIDEAFLLLQSDPDVDSVICVTDVPSKFYAELQVESFPDGSVRPALEGISPQRRQDLPARFVRCGNLYAARVDFFEATGSLVGGKIRAVRVEPHFSLDIDTAEDMNEAEIRMSRSNEFK